MTVAADEPTVDWAAVERDWSRRQLREVLVVALAMAAYCVLAFGVQDGGWWWLVGVGLFVVVAIFTNARPLGWRRLARRQAAAARISFAVREHIDPGPDFHARAEVAARAFVRARWTGVALPFVLAAPPATGHWHALWFVLAAAVVLSAGIGLVSGLLSR